LRDLQTKIFSAIIAVFSAIMRLIYLIRAVILVRACNTVYVVQLELVYWIYIYITGYPAIAPN